MSDSDDNIQEDWDDFVASVENSANPTTRPLSLSPDTAEWQKFVGVMATSDMAHNSPPSTQTSNLEPEASLEPTTGGTDDEYRPSSVPDPVRYLSASPSPNEEEDEQRRIGKSSFVFCTSPGPILMFIELQMRSLRTQASGMWSSRDSQR